MLWSGKEHNNNVDTWWMRQVYFPYKIGFIVVFYYDCQSGRANAFIYQNTKALV